MRSRSSDSDEDLEFDKDEGMKECENSNLALFLTRRQFKQNEIRFSNAYDHFLLNRFPVSEVLSVVEEIMTSCKPFFSQFFQMKYKIDGTGSSRKLSLTSDHEQILKNIEKLVFTILKEIVIQYSSIYR